MFKPTFCTDLVPYLNLILFVNADLLVLVELDEASDLALWAAELYYLQATGGS